MPLCLSVQIGTLVYSYTSKAPLDVAKAAFSLGTNNCCPAEKFLPDPLWECNSAVGCIAWDGFEIIDLVDDSPVLSEEL
jgi:hypothetical protein